MKNIPDFRKQPRGVFAGLLLFLALVSPAMAQDTDAPASLATPGQTPTTYDNPELVMRYQATITPQDMAARLYFFASDFFEGRETTTRGQKLAANYLASQYRKMGVLPKGTAAPSNLMDPSAYMQPFDLYGSRLSSATLEIMRNGESIASSVYSADETDENAYLMFGSNTEATGGVVFVGYGIADDELGYNDYAALEAAGISATDGWLMLLQDEPLESAEKSLLPTEDGAPSSWTTSRFKKISSMMSSGSLPKGVLIVSDSSPRSETSVAEAAKQAANGLQGAGGLSLNESSEGGRSFPPMYAISTEFADMILASTGQTVASIQERINNSLEPVVMAIPDIQISSTLLNENYTASTENVVAFIEGSDPLLKDEYVVISSHYDHVGMKDVEAPEDGIFNGADDDGSGTITVLEIAEAFAEAKNDGFGPRRSILFLNVTGEEKGLLGSAYYTDKDPIIPLDKTVTNLNIDMIGRVDPTHPGKDSNYVYIIGSKLISEELHEINSRVNELVGTNLDLNERFNSKDDPNRFYARSDHANFGKNGIPFIFFFTGTHEDYHGVDDEPDRIEYERMSRIGQMIFATAWQIANQDARPAISGKGFN